MCVLSAELIIRVPLCVWLLQTQRPEEEKELWCSQAVLVPFSGVVSLDPAHPNLWDVLGDVADLGSAYLGAVGSPGGRFAGESLWNPGWFGLEGTSKLISSHNMPWDAFSWTR